MMELTEEALLGLGAEAAGMPSAMSSSPCTPVEEERPGSSLSTASRSSRIPRLTRSSSLRIKTTQEPKTNADSRNKNEHHSSSKSGSRGIVRSSSFVTSRGMAGGGGGSSHHSPSNSSLMSSYHSPASSSSHRMSSSRTMSHPHTPETPRRFSHSGNYPRRTNSISERKSHASQPDTPSRSPVTDLDDGGGEGDSVKSFGSASSALSCDAGLTRHHNLHHHHGGGGGWGRNSKFTLHCRHNHDLDPETYLTPTQRAARKIRELKSQLAEARRDVHVRDAEITRLTRELVELRLIKARTQQEEKTSSKAEVPNTQVILRNGDASARRCHQPTTTAPLAAAASSTPTPKTSSTPSEGSEPELSRLMDNLNTGAQEAVASHLPVVSPAGGSVAETTEGSVDLTRSLADSGHYDDLTSPCLSSRDPFEASQNSLRDRRTDEEDEEEEVDPWAAVEETEVRLREEYDRREDQLKRNHMDEYHELKEKHNDRVEALLSKLSDANLKYFELRPQYDRSQEKIRELEREASKLRDELTEAELRHQKMYLQMFLKGQQAAKLQADDEQDGEEGSQSSLSSNGPMVDLLKQLARTEEELDKMKVLYQREIANRANNNTKYRNGELDPEVTLQFLKSAIYYFFTDKDNAKGHLRAIESILGYTDSERRLIDKLVK